MKLRIASFVLVFIGVVLIIFEMTQEHHIYSISGWDYTHSVSPYTLLDLVLSGDTPTEIGNGFEFRIVTHNEYPDLRIYEQTYNRFFIDNAIGLALVFIGGLGAVISISRKKVKTESVLPEPHN